MSTVGAARPGGGPCALADLRIALIGREALAADLSSACRVESLTPVGWSDSLGAPRPDLLLVEGEARLGPEWSEELANLLDAFGRAGVPRFLWVTSAAPDPAWVRQVERFERGFAAGVGQLMKLFEAGFREPSLLWLATALPVDDRPPLETASRPDHIAWLGGWRSDWPEAWRVRLIEVLRAAAECGLCISGVADPEPLPAELRPHICTEPASRAEVLERARLVIAADPEAAAPDLVPPVLFDALACGAAVVSPSGAGSAWDFCADGTAGRPPRELIPAVRDYDAAAAEIDRLLADDPLREEIVHRCRRVVAYNHTYAHRAATLASAAGLRLLPDAS